MRMRGFGFDLFSFAAEAITRPTRSCTPQILAYYDQYAVAHPAGRKDNDDDEDDDDGDDNGDNDNNDGDGGGRHDGEAASPGDEQEQQQQRRRHQRERHALGCALQLYRMLGVPVVLDVDLFLAAPDADFLALQASRRNCAF